MSEQAMEPPQSKAQCLLQVSFVLTVTTYIFPQINYFHVILRKNSDYFPTQRYPIGLLLEMRCILCSIETEY
jgi:hypothetical protein